MRGAPYFYIFLSCDVGIIPAYAGSTTDMGGTSSPKKDHPRVCGEHWEPVAFSEIEQGSSPRMRGALRTERNSILEWGIIPAYAGSTLL